LLFGRSKLVFVSRLDYIRTHVRDNVRREAGPAHRPLRTWAAHDLSAVPVADLPVDIEILLRLRNEVEGALLRRLQPTDHLPVPARRHQLS